ncbi:LLM class flavin-dependent oxidoreductase [Sphingobacterium sp.]|uniref:LLM class flavin-dependent oxidoreductase n=1 Tax=Sphingobacterium sp. TaxID=341027 RepID=UPI0031D53249
MKIGLLEFGVGYKIPNNFINYIFDYAKKAEELGFSRLWLGEHYFLNASWHSPEILIALIAGMTDELKVGCAGVLMSIHRPFEIALQYKMLANLFPKRIDLGFAKGGIHSTIAESLEIELNNHPAQYEDNITKLNKILNDESLVLRLPPASLILPELWGLTSGRNNFENFAERKFNCSISLFHAPFKKDVNDSLSIINENICKYREIYSKRWGVTPKINFSVAGICEYSISAANKRWALLENKLDLVIYNPVVGCSSFIYEKLCFFREKLEVDEIVFLNLEPEPRYKIDGIIRLSKTCL